MAPAGDPSYLVFAQLLYLVIDVYGFISLDFAATTNRLCLVTIGLIRCALWRREFTLLDLLLQYVKARFGFLKLLAA